MEFLLVFSLLRKFNLFDTSNAKQFSHSISLLQIITTHSLKDLSTHYL